MVKEGEGHISNLSKDELAARKAFLKPFDDYVVLQQFAPAFESEENKERGYGIYFFKQQLGKEREFIVSGAMCPDEVESFNFQIKKGDTIERDLDFRYAFVPPQHFWHITSHHRAKETNIISESEFLKKAEAYLCILDTHQEIQVDILKVVVQQPGFYQLFHKNKYYEATRTKGTQGNCFVRAGFKIEPKPGYVFVKRMNAAGETEDDPYIIKQSFLATDQFLEAMHAGDIKRENEGSLFVMNDKAFYDKTVRESMPLLVLEKKFPEVMQKGIL